jgi:hypothetical protein
MICLVTRFTAWIGQASVEITENVRLAQAQVKGTSRKGVMGNIDEELSIPDFTPNEAALILA